MRDFLRKVWNDPVGSTLIATLIIALLTALYSLVQSYLENKSFTDVLLTIWSIKISAWKVVVLVVLIVLILRRRPDSFSYDQDSLRVDSELFQRIRLQLLPESGTIGFIKNHDFGANFQLDRLNDLHRFFPGVNMADCEFLNPELESLKLDLVRSLINFSDFAANNTFDVGRDFQGVPKDLPNNIEIIKTLNVLSRNAGQKYTEFIRTGRKILKIP